jgi:AcrR family transcriptional regulator
VRPRSAAAPGSADGQQGRGLRFRDPLAMAVMRAVRERGYARARIGDLLEGSGVSRAEFDRSFTGKADVILQVMEANIGDFKSRVGTAYDAESSWPENLRAGGWEMARWIRDNPESVWFDTVGVLGAGDMVLVRREELFRWGVGLVDAGRQVAPDPAVVPRSAPVHVVGSIVETVRRFEESSLLDDAFTSVPRMMYAAVRPYLGEEAARAELEIPPPPDLARSSGNPPGA